MKKALGLFSVVLLLLVLLPGTGQAQIRFGFKAYGGLAYLGGGDLNKGMQGFNDWNTDWLDIWGLNPDGEFSPLHLGMDFGGEFILQFTPNMGVGLGVGYISATNESTLDYSPTISGLDFLWKPTATAIPITATFYYFLPTGGNMKFFVDLGLGYYLATMKLENAFLDVIIPVLGESEATGGGLGFHGGLGLVYDFSPMFGLVAEIKGRYAAFSNFEGSTDISFPWGGSGFTEEGPLYLWEVTSDYPLLWISATEPSNANPAKVDFSGFSFTIGFMVHF